MIDAVTAGKQRTRSRRPAAYFLRMPTYAFPLQGLRPELAPHLEKSLAAVPRVRSAHVDLQAGRVEINHHGASEVGIRAVLHRIGVDMPPPAPKL
jgi:hypothetical protein